MVNISINLKCPFLLIPDTKRTQSTLRSLKLNSRHHHHEPPRFWVRRNIFVSVCVNCKVRVFFWSFFDSCQKRTLSTVQNLTLNSRQKKLKLPIQSDKIVNLCSQSLNKFLLLTLPKKAKKEAI